jgi:hypothetical protein
MSNAFSLKLTEDAERHRVYIFATGEMDSRQYIDRQIAQLEADRHLCAYDRLVDVRQSLGFVSGDEVARYAGYWSKLRFEMPRTIRVAVVTENRFVAARLPLSNLSYPKQVMQAFGTIEEAEAWLDAGLLVMA